MVFRQSSALPDEGALVTLAIFPHLQKHPLPHLPSSASTPSLFHSMTLDTQNALYNSYCQTESDDQSIDL